MVPEGMIYLEVLAVRLSAVRTRSSTWGAACLGASRRCTTLT